MFRTVLVDLTAAVLGEAVEVAPPFLAVVRVLATGLGTFLAGAALVFLADLTSLSVTFCKTTFARLPSSFAIVRGDFAAVVFPTCVTGLLAGLADIAVPFLFCCLSCS